MSINKVEIAGACRAVSDVEQTRSEIEDALRKLGLRIEGPVTFKEKFVSDDPLCAGGMYVFWKCNITQ